MIPRVIIYVATADNILLLRCGWVTTTCINRQGIMFVRLGFSKQLGWWTIGCSLGTQRVKGTIVAS